MRDNTGQKYFEYGHFSQSTLYKFQNCFCCPENSSVANQTQKIWTKIVETLKFCIDLPKLKQRGKGKPGQSTSYDILANNIEDSFILLNLLFFEEMFSSLNDFLVVFQTDNSTIHFIAGTLEFIIRYLCSQFTRKEVLQYISFSLDLCKIDVTDKKLPVDSVDLGFAIRHDIAILKNLEKSPITNCVNLPMEL